LYLSYIDGIRALAVLSVFIYHLDPHWLPGGFSGVDVFFVVSGYVVSLSLDKQKGVALPTFLAVFYSRRVKRILPALIFCLLITIVFTVLFIPSSHLSGSHAKTALFAFFGLSNIILASGNDDYFGPMAEFNPFTHTWSLGVEEQFYLLFPFIFILWTSGKKKYNKQISVVIFLGLFVASICAAYWYSNTNKLYEYYLIFSRFWQLAAGILLYQFVKSSYESKLRPYKKFFVVLSWIALALVLSGFIVSDEARFPIPWAFLGVSGTFLLLFSMHYLHEGRVRLFLENKFLSIIGKMSYSLYLWHWPVIVLFRWTIGINTPSNYLSVVAITFFMSSVSYYFIETTIRTLPFIVKSPRYSVIIVGLFILATSSYVGAQLFLNKAEYTFSITKNMNDWYGDVYNPFLEEGLNGEPTVSIENFKSGMKHVFGSKGPSTGQKLFVLGDSHAHAYIAMLRKFSAKTGSETIVYTSAGCGDTINRTFEVMGKDCENFLNASLDEITSQSESGDVLFLPSLKLLRFTAQWENYDIALAKERMVSEGAQNLRKLAVSENITRFKPLAQKGLRIIYEAPKPIFKAPPFRCSQWFNEGNPICSEGLGINKGELINYRQPIMDALESIVSALDNAYIYDPLDILCPEDTCNAIAEGKPLFFDGDHLSGYGNMLIYDDFRGFLRSVTKSDPYLTTSTYQVHKPTYKLESISGAYTTETGDNKTWNWTKDTVEYLFYSSGDTKKAIVKFQYLSAGGARTLSLEILTDAGQLISSLEIPAKEGWGECVTQIIETNAEDIIIRLKADGDPVRLSSKDSREAKFLIQNLSVLVI
jgi:peptidoglycan/LPS O-acetylase OafA/YrhL